MTRRDLLKLLLSSAIAESIDVEKLLWTPKPIITVPTLPISLYGIPYHEYNFSSGEWLGICRDQSIYNEIINMINSIKEHEIGWGK